MSGDLTLNDVVLIDGTGASAVPGRVVERSHRRGRARRGMGTDRAGWHWRAAVREAEELSADQLLLNWRAYLRSGVTSVVSTGDDPQRMIAARAAERAGELVGPRSSRRAA